MDVAVTVFLSYAREDEDRVEMLYHRLSSEGFAPWMDKKNILPGEKWRLSIQRALRDCDFFLTCLSTRSFNKRGLLQKEIQTALDICNEKLDTDIYLIPVRLEECKAPENLKDHQWVNLFDKDGFDRLVAALKKGIQQRTSGSEPIVDSVAQQSSQVVLAQPLMPETLPTTQSSSATQRELRLNDLQELIGTRLGDYVLESVLGFGHDGVVFLAHPIGLEHKIAIRVYGLLSSASVNLEGTLGEIKNRSFLNHPSVLIIYEPGIAEVEFQGSIQRVLYVPMQYAPLGDSKQSPPFKDKQITIGDIDALIGLVDALRTIHENGIIHRDLRPSNILRFQERLGGEDATIFRIVDFGVATAIKQPEQSGRVGFLVNAYAAPEQLEFKFSTKNDIYSLGATLFYMFTGIDPVSSKTSDDQTPWEPKSNAMDYNPYCPPRLALLIIQMMSLNPDDRPSAEECIQSLRDIRETVSYKILGFPVPYEIQTLLDSEEFRIWYTPPFGGIFKPDVHLLFGTTLFVLRFRMAHPVLSEYKRLIEFMARNFSDCFSMYETYGSYDLHVLVWTDWEQAKNLRRVVDEQFPGTLVEIMHSTNLNHIHFHDVRTNRGPTLVGAVAVQEHIKLPDLDKSIYLCDEYPSEPPQHAIRALTYVNEAVGVGPINSFIRVAIVEGVRRKMLELVSQTDEGKRRFPKISLMDLSGDNSVAGPVALVSFVARDYKFLHQIPIAITELGENAVTAPTFLETGRIVMQSDKILI